MPRGTGTITKVPKGKGQTKPIHFEYGSTKHSCTAKGTISMTGGAFPSAIGNATFACSGCKRLWPDLEFVKAYKDALRKQAAKIKPKKKVKFQPDSPELVAAIRAEIKRRTEILTREREKFPPTNLLKGKRLVPNPAFTSEMREHMHGLGFSAMEIRDELLKGA